MKRRGLSARYWVDGKLVSAARAVLPVTDLTATRGYGAFESLRTYGGVPFQLDGHLRRLSVTCRHLHLRLPLSRPELKEAVRQTLEANGFEESLIRIYLTGGDATGFLPEGRERLMIFAGPVKPLPKWKYEEGIALKSTGLQRSIPEAKTIDYTAGIRETVVAVKEGFHEVVFRDGRGRLLEGTQFAIAAIAGKRLITPQEGILPGITMDCVVKIARREGYTIERAPLAPAILRKADEVFAASTVREVLPVVRVDEVRIGDGRPGPATLRLHRLYLESAHKATRRAWASK